jgi:hypothetical protein
LVFLACVSTLGNCAVTTISGFAVDDRLCGGKTDGRIPGKYLNLLLPMVGVLIVAPVALRLAFYLRSFHFHSQIVSLFLTT